MIGKKVRFIRPVYRGDRGVEKNLEYIGTVLDKCRGRERVEGKFFSVDYYMVELSDGIVAKFYPDEATNIIHPTPELPFT
jgi:hypothetical protein